MFVAYLRRHKLSLHPVGQAVAKVDMSTDFDGKDLFDKLNDSVTTTEGRFQKRFEWSRLQTVGMELQTLRIYVLQPRAASGI